MEVNPHPWKRKECVSRESKMRTNRLSVLGPTTPVSVTFGEVVVDGGSPVKVEGEVCLDILRRKFTFDIQPDPNEPRSEECIELVRATLQEMYDLWQAVGGIEVLTLLGRVEKNP
jgi:hypothetical protein